MTHAGGEGFSRQQRHRPCPRAYRGGVARAPFNARPGGFHTRVIDGASGHIKENGAKMDISALSVTRGHSPWAGSEERTPR